MKQLAIIILIGFLNLGYISENKNEQNKIQKSEIECTEKGCYGIYKGPEFIDGSDVAHQLSNKISNDVGIKLKQLYIQGYFKKVDFSKIEMTTKGMGTGYVVYVLAIPFISVDKKCDSYTSFDHVGGWNHAPNLSKRKEELKKALMDGHQLNISELKTTPEGLQEYWIQWKNKNTQSDCK